MKPVTKSRTAVAKVSALMLTAVLLSSGAVHAHHNSRYVDDQRYYTDKFNKHWRHYNKYYNGNSYTGKHYTGKHYRYGKQANKRYAAAERVRLDLPVRVRGDGQVRLRRLIREHYDIDLRNYTLRRVVVHNRRHHGEAQLNVGRYSTECIALYRGKTSIRAPRADGRWTLDLAGVKTDYIRVVLEPKQRWARVHHPRARRQA